MENKRKIIISSIIIIAIVVIGGIIVAIESKEEEGLTNAINTPIVENTKNENTIQNSQTTEEPKEEQKTDTETEKEKIENYIKKIYGWAEVYGVALPEFEDINNADETWLWDILKKSKENTEYKYSELEELKTQIYGSTLQKNFPVEGTQYLIYDAKSDMYLPVGIGLDENQDLFTITNYKKEENKYIVEIAEYILTEVVNETILNEEIQNQETENKEEQTQEYEIQLKDTKGNKITTFKSTDTEETIKKYVEANKHKFTKKQLQIEIDGESLHIKSVKSI